MASRLRPLTQSVDVFHDGDRIAANAGEALVHTLIAADRLVLTRSPKLHRPRGPYCLRAACEGCLVRVDGVPNVMACRHRVKGGERVETQNVLGSRELDVLAATDFLFPHGVDHHRLFAGVRGVSAVVGALARRIAGLGRLPDVVQSVRPGERLEVPVLIVGGGGAGLAAAAELGPLALLVDDGLTLGGARASLAPAEAAELATRAERAGARLRPATTAAGLYVGPDTVPGAVTVVLAGEHGASLVFARAVLLATGEHDGPPDFPGNDLPGVFSAHAGLMLLHAGILPARRVAIVGKGRFADRLANELGSHVVLSATLEDVVRAQGRLRIRSITVRDASEERRVRVGALFVAGLSQPAFELLVQAGGRVVFDAQRGYLPVLDSDGLGAPNVWCAGRVTGSDEDPLESGRRAARAVARALSAR